MSRRTYIAFHKTISVIVSVLILVQASAGLIMAEPLPSTDPTWEKMIFSKNTQASFSKNSSSQVASSIYLPLIMHNYQPPAPIEEIIEPGIGGEIGSPDGVVRIAFSGDAITQTLIVRYETIEPPALPPNNLGVAGPAFAITAETVDGQPLSKIPFTVERVANAETGTENSTVSPNATISVRYTPNGTNGLDLRSLFLYTPDGTGGWNRTTSATFQDDGYLMAEVEQLGEFVPMAEIAARQINASTDTVPFALDPDDNDASIYWPKYNETWYEGVLNYRLAEQVQQRFIDDECDVDILITRDASQQNGTISNNIRAQAAINHGSSMFITLAFNTYLGTPWGSGGDGGMRVWRRSGNADDNALANQLVARISEYTARPSTLWGNGAFYAEFSSLPMVYSHSETLFMDHNVDGAVIHDGFNLIADAIYAATATRLGEMGVTCGEDNQPPSIPAPPSEEVLQRLRDLGQQNIQTYGTKYDLIRKRNAMFYGSDPVNFSTGNFIKQANLFTLPGQGGMDFNFSLFYNGQDGRSDLFGNGWSFPYNARLQRYSDDSVAVTLNDGRTLYYTWNGSSYDPQAGIYEELRQVGAGWEWETMDGTILTFEDTITGLGILTQWQDRQGNALHFVHDLSGQNAWEDGNDVPRPPLVSMSDDNGRTATFTTNDDGLVTRIDLFDGRFLTFDYDGDKNLTEIGKNGDVQERFAYDSRHRMTDLWDAEDIHYLQNIYDDRDRVVEQLDASDVHAYLDYDPIAQETTFTDNLGNVEVYHYDDLNRVTAVEDARDGDEAYVYDDNYNLLSYTDANGNTTEYEYDANGNLTQRTDPIDGYSSEYYGDDVSNWTYNDQNLVTSYTNALGHTWTYEYDGDGNLTRSVAPDRTETTAVYDNFGQPTSITDALNHTTEFTYDADGNLTDTEYADGTTSSSTYDSSGRETSYTDANNHTVQFGYDDHDNIDQILDPKLNPSQFFYDNNNLLTRALDRRNGETLYQYNDDLKLIAERDAEQNWTQYGYDAMYNRSVMTDSLGFATHYEYDEAYNLERVIAPNGGITRYSYDDNGNMTAVIDPNNHRTRFVYDAMNRVKFTIDATGARTEFCYNAEDQLIRVIDPRHAVTDYEYDSVGNLVRMIDPYAEITEYEHDAIGNMVAVTDTLGFRTDMAYDDLDRLVTVMNPILPNGRPTTQFAYDNVGNTTTITNPMGFATTFRYDENDNSVTITDPLGGEINYQYDAEDNPTTVTDQNNNDTTVDYNLVGLPTAVTDPLGYTSVITYNAVYNTVAQSDPMGRTMEYDYDEMGWLTTAADPLNYITRYNYDLAGQTTAVTDANNHTTNYDYDGAGRLITVTDAISGTTAYTYDIVGNLATITNANGSLTQFEYNLYNQLSREINPLGNRWNYSYDEAGRLIRKVDANWRATYYEYDSNGRLLSTRYGTLPPATAPVTYTYDLNGNETMMCDGLGCTTNSYDALDRPTMTTDWLNRTITRTYDAASNLTALTYPNGNAVQYDYNANDWLTDITIPGGHTSNYSHNPAGQVTAITHPNNTIASYSYDGAGRLTEIDNRQLGAPQPQSAYQYALDAVGNRTQVTETRAAFDGSAAPVELLHTYQYDELDRLINATTASPDSSTDYAFDAVGNRLMKSGTVLTPDEATPELPVAPRPEQVNYSYNEADQLLTTDNTIFIYDDNGNRIQETETVTNGVTLTTTYAYDREDRLVNVTKSAGITVAMVATYTYDGYGRRALKEVTYPNAITPTQIITYTYDGLDIIGAQIAVSDTVTQSYYYLGKSTVTGMRRPFALERQTNPTTAFPGDIHWYQTDGLDSVITLTDMGGDIASPYLYDEYGNQLAGTTELQLFAYTGQDYDPETSFSHYYSRHYDSRVGIWIEQDSYYGRLREPKTLNRYGYTQNNPTTNIDVLGFDTLVVDRSTALATYTYDNGTSKIMRVRVGSTTPTGHYVIYDWKFTGCKGNPECCTNGSFDQSKCQNDCLTGYCDPYGWGPMIAFLKDKNTGRPERTYTLHGAGDREQSIGFQPWESGRSCNRTNNATEYECKYQGAGCVALAHNDIQEINQRYWQGHTIDVIIKNNIPPKPTPTPIVTPTPPSNGGGTSFGSGWLFIMLLIMGFFVSFTTWWDRKKVVKHV